MTYHNVWLCLFFLIAGISKGQNIGEIISGQESEDYFTTAETLYQNQQYYEALFYFEQSLKKEDDVEKVILYSRLAHCAFYVRSYDKALKYLLLLKDNKVRLTPGENLLAVKIFLSNEKIDEAREMINIIDGEEAMILKEKISFIHSHADSPSHFYAEPASYSVNKRYQTRGGIFQGDTLWFSSTSLVEDTRKKHFESVTGTYEKYYQSDIYYSILQNGIFKNRVILETQRKYRKYDLSDPHPLPGGKSILFTLCFYQNNHCQIARGDLQNNSIKNITLLSHPINKEKSSTIQPFLYSSEKHNILFFSSDREEKTDVYNLYYCYPDRNFSCEDVYPVGKPVNSPGNEVNPFYYEGDLYFSSDYHPGFGNYDVFLAKGSPDQGFSSPVNLGERINSQYDDYYFSLCHQSDSIYGTIVSNREDKKTSSMFDHLFLVYPKQKETSKKETSAYNNFDKQDSSFIMIDGNLPVTIKEGEKITFHSILFETDLAHIDSSSYHIIETIARFLHKHPEVHIEISGHTDSTGSYNYNLELSQKRAEEVKKHLVKEGIDESRLSATGYGFSDPITGNATNKGKKQNRRVEIIITKTGR